MKTIVLSGGNFGGTEIAVDDGSTKSMFGRQDEQGVWVYDLTISEKENEAVFIGMATAVGLTPEQAAQLVAEG